MSLEPGYNKNTDLYDLARDARRDLLSIRCGTFKWIHLERFFSRRQFSALKTYGDAGNSQSTRYQFGVTLSYAFTFSVGSTGNWGMARLQRDSSHP